MKRLNIEIHEDLMKDIKMKAAKEKVFLRVFVTRALLEALHRNEKTNAKS